MNPKNEDAENIRGKNDNRFEYEDAQNCNGKGIRHNTAADKVEDYT